MVKINELNKKILTDQKNINIVAYVRAFVSETIEDNNNSTLIDKFESFKHTLEELVKLIHDGRKYNIHDKFLFIMDVVKEDRGENSIQKLLEINNCIENTDYILVEKYDIEYDMKKTYYLTLLCFERLLLPIKNNIYKKFYSLIKLGIKYYDELNETINSGKICSLSTIDEKVDNEMIKENESYKKIYECSNKHCKIKKSLNMKYEETHQMFLKDFDNRKLELENMITKLEEECSEKLYLLNELRNEKCNKLDMNYFNDINKIKEKYKKL